MTRLLGTAGLAAAVIGAAPAAASACEFGSTTRAFSQFGDTNDYFLAPGGDFETLTWKASPGARLVSGNEPFRLAPGVSSLELDSGESATSPEFCVSRETPHLRYVAKGSGLLSADVRLWTPARSISVSVASWSFDGREWAPGRDISLWTWSLGEGESARATVTFRSQGDWLIDNVFVDPYRR